MDSENTGPRWRRDFLVRRCWDQIRRLGWSPWHDLQDGARWGREWILEINNRGTRDVRLRHLKTESVIYLPGLSQEEAGSLTVALRDCYIRTTPPEE